MTKTLLAAHIAAIRKELAADSAENCERLVMGLLEQLDDQDSKRLDWLLNPSSDGLAQVFKRTKGTGVMDWNTVFDRESIDDFMNKTP